MSPLAQGSAAQRVCVVGLGLIGGSIARGLKGAAQPPTVVGCVADESERQRALALGIADQVRIDPTASVAGAELVVFAVPAGAMPALLAAIAPHLGADAVVTDVAGTKQDVLAAAAAALGPRISRFVGGHPIAGTEHSGLDAGFETLFAGQRVILTPSAHTDAAAIQRVEAMWAALGATVSTMDAAHHDELLAATSHLPHVLAFALVDTLARLAERTEIFEFAAGGFADFTRIASSDPALWADIVATNREAVLPVLDRYAADLGALRAAIAGHDRERLRATFARAKTARDAFADRRAGP